MATSDLVLGAWERLGRLGAISDHTRRAKRFGSFGPRALICFPPVALYNEHAIHIGADTLIGPNVSLSAGMAPGQPLITDRMLVIGDRCLIGRGSSIVAHFEIVIEDDVFFGPNVYVTDQNHAVDDPTLPIGKQSAPEKPVRIGKGSWIGTNAVVLPGVTIGEGVAVGAGAVVTADLPPFTVAVGSPARVIAERPRG